MHRARTAAAALFRRVFLINGAIFVVGTLALALSPATVSSRIKLTEIPVLVIGLAVMLTANGLLLRSGLAPMLKVERTTAGATALAAQENERQRIALVDEPCRQANGGACLKELSSRRNLNMWIHGFILERNTTLITS